jgi:hypothetical protein
MFGHIGKIRKKVHNDAMTKNIIVQIIVQWLKT